MFSFMSISEVDMNPENIFSDPANKSEVRWMGLSGSKWGWLIYCANFGQLEGPKLYYLTIDKSYHWLFRSVKSKYGRPI